MYNNKGSLQNKKTGYLMTSIKKVGGGSEQKPDFMKIEK